MPTPQEVISSIRLGKNDISNELHHYFLSHENYICFQRLPGVKINYWDSQRNLEFFPRKKNSLKFSLKVTSIVDPSKIELEQLLDVDTLNRFVLNGSTETESTTTKS